MLGLVADKKPRALERLDEIKNPRLRRAESGEAVLKRSDPMTKMLEMATPALAKPSNQKRGRTGKLKTRLPTPAFAPRAPLAMSSA